jgi:hypothetical protein
MTKKHYTAIANILGKRLAEKQHAPIGEYEAVEVLALDLAKHFTNENPRFNEDRFLEVVYGATPEMALFGKIKNPHE